MIIKKIFLFLTFFVFVPCVPAQKDIINPGVELFVSGNLDGAINSFDGILKKNPFDSRIKEILGNCLVLKGKRFIEEGKYPQGQKALKRAEIFLPGNQEIKTLRLFAELDEIVPSENMAVSSMTLNSPVEMWAVFDCIFGVGKCADYGRYLIHMVQEGETMSTIADKYYKDYTMWEKIWESNPKIPNPHRLEKGVRLIIPLQ